MSIETPESIAGREGFERGEAFARKQCEARPAALEAALARVTGELQELQQDGITGETQDRIRDLVSRLSGLTDIDGSGSDAGPVELTLAEIEQGFNAISDERDALTRQLEEAQAELNSVQAHNDVLDGTWCDMEQADGNGPCGACIKCLRSEIERLSAWNSMLLAETTGQRETMVQANAEAQRVTLLNEALTRQLQTERERGERMLKPVRAAVSALRSYQYGNASPDLAKEVADALEAALSPTPEAQAGEVRHG